MGHIQVWEISGGKYEVEVGESAFRVEKYGIGSRAQFMLKRLVPGQITEIIRAFKTKEEAFAFCEQL